ncbi:hypothetical protein K523DRAFT_320255 [Schizophyllum commune Tattone D]|nr:hypothetical protein K523DRAFT_320255 [Schizophyllum commune Tattone D]
MRTTAPAIAPDASTSARILDLDMVPSAPATAQHDDALDITGHAFEVRISSPATLPSTPSCAQTTYVHGRVGERCAQPKEGMSVKGWGTPSAMFS